MPPHQIVTMRYTNPIDKSINAEGAVSAGNETNGIPKSTQTIRRST